MSERTYHNATHKLWCRHCIGQSCRDYAMRAHILKTMPDGRKKVLAFGGMWKGMEEVQRVRYVQPDALELIRPTAATEEGEV
ncbi:hypothetical protein [Leptolyngbya phage Lbo-JY16]